jgi:hypothetical protein
MPNMLRQLERLSINAYFTTTTDRHDPCSSGNATPWSASQSEDLPDSCDAHFGLYKEVIRKYRERKE